MPTTSCALPVAIAVAVLSLTACSRVDTTPAPAPVPAPLASSAQVANGVVDAASAAGTVALGWQGTWNGPEGTSLQIQPDGYGFQVIVKNLDGPRTFAGQQAGSEIRFERDGVTESIKAGNGTQTGMKWLDGKNDCLVVKAGEGYCRD